LSDEADHLSWPAILGLPSSDQAGLDTISTRGTKMTTKRIMTPCPFRSTCPRVDLSPAYRCGYEIAGTLEYCREYRERRKLDADFHIETPGEAGRHQASEDHADDAD